MEIITSYVIFDQSINYQIKPHMEPVQNARKVWAKPTVQLLNINSDTYANPGRGDKEVGQGGGNNKDKSIPS